jgi:hypothetical protein
MAHPRACSMPLAPPKSRDDAARNRQPSCQRCRAMVLSVGRHTVSSEYGDASGFGSDLHLRALGIPHYLRSPIGFDMQRHMAFQSAIHCLGH